MVGDLAKRFGAWLNVMITPKGKGGLYCLRCGESDYTEVSFLQFRCNNCGAAGMHPEHWTTVRAIAAHWSERKRRKEN